jgi:predicted transcriptional regulator
VTKRYETLDEYLDDLDKIKEQIAEETKDMTARQLTTYLNGARKRVEEITRKKLRLRKDPRKRKAAVRQRSR